MSSGTVAVRSGTLWYDIDHLGPEYSNLVLDAIPCVISTSNGVSNGVSNSSDARPAIPAELSVPLIKGRLGCGQVSAFGSGARSALIKSKSHEGRIGKWYRLKGCGMPDVGFTVVDVLDDMGKPRHLETFVAGGAEGEGGEEDSGGAVRKVLRKIRGSSYHHTCAIELTMSSEVDKILMPLGKIKHNSSCVLQCAHFTVIPRMSNFTLLCRFTVSKSLN